MTYTKLVKTVNHTYRAWDSDMLDCVDLSMGIGSAMYGTLSTDQRNELYESAECQLTPDQIRSLQHLLRGSILGGI